MEHNFLYSLIVDLLNGVSSLFYAIVSDFLQQWKDPMFQASLGAAIFSLTGAFLNARKKWYSFAVWAAANMFWLVYDFRIGAYFQSLLFTCYLFMNVYGFYCWKMKDLKFDNEIKQENSPEKDREAA